VKAEESSSSLVAKEAPGPNPEKPRCMTKTAPAHDIIRRSLAVKSEGPVASWVTALGGRQSAHVIARAIRRSPVFIVVGSLS
jgi:hypothetical protein